jgi:signal peptidase II
MNFFIPLWGYALSGLLIFSLDRITKWLALSYLEDAYHITDLLSFDLVMNRGISWSLFHSAGNTMFIILTAMIACIIAGLLVHTIVRWHKGYMVVGEVMTLVGGLSNLVDRIVYGGVIDFIVFSFGSWSFPVFNLADCSIVIGIGIMFLSLYKNP